MSGVTKKLMSVAGGGVGAPWDISEAVYNGSPVNYFVTTEDSSVGDIFFRDDGLKMYSVGAQNDNIYEYDLSTAWQVSTASFLQSFSVAVQETAPTGMHFRSDGLAMYVVGNATDAVNEYSLSTAWDISTSSFVRSFSVVAQGGNPRGVFFKPDGTKMYIVNNSTDFVYEYNLSTAWNVSTTSFQRSFSLAAQLTGPNGPFFRDDGLKMYIITPSTDSIFEYDLSTAWNVSTLSFVRSLSFASTLPDAFTQSVFFKPDGTKMYVLNDPALGAYQSTPAVYEHELTTAWNISTASYTPPTKLSISAQETVPNGISFKPDGTKMYIVGSTGDDVNEYDLSTAWDELTASFLQSFSVSTQETIPESVFFKPDGTKMYIVGRSNDTVYEYDLSTAWDVSTSVAVQSFSVAAQETIPTGLFFKPDGLKMYVIGYTGDDVNEYDLSTAWNISTASFLQSFSVAAEANNPDGVFFKPDGRKMYVVNGSGRSVNEYDLSTAWDISTASFLQELLTSRQLIMTPTGVFFKPDGTKMYIVDSETDAVYSYVL